jgi:hypothetical protein
VEAAEIDKLTEIVVTWCSTGGHVDRIAEQPFEGTLRCPEERRRATSWQLKYIDQWTFARSTAMSVRICRPGLSLDPSAPG